MAAKPKGNIEEIVTCVTSSNLERLTALTRDRIPIVPQFPLCGQWRKSISLLHLAAAYGSLTSMQYLIGQTDVNVQTEDGVSLVAIGRQSVVLLQIVICAPSNFFSRKGRIRNWPFFFC
jgi:hypothetical protein